MGRGTETGLEEARDLPWRALVRRGAQAGWGRGGRKWGLQPWQGGYRIFHDEVRLTEENVSQSHVHLICHMKLYKEVEAHCAWFSRS